MVWVTLRVNTNWKFASDNFNEAYHIPAVHPQFMPMIDDHYSTTLFEMYPTVHNRMIEKLQPSSRLSADEDMQPLWEDVLRAWDINPDDYRGRAQEARLALQQARREKGPERGMYYFDDLLDDELADQMHHTVFPNLAITATAEGVHVFRTEPNAEDPNWSTFDYWYLAPPIEGDPEVPTLFGMRSFEETQQRGLRSMAFEDCYLSGQETRVRRFHEVLNDYLEGRR